MKNDLGLNGQFDSRPISFNEVSGTRKKVPNEIGGTV